MLTEETFSHDTILKIYIQMNKFSRYIACYYQTSPNNLIANLNKPSLSFPFSKVKKLLRYRIFHTPNHTFAYIYDR